MTSKPDSMETLLGLSVKPLKQDKVVPYRKPIEPLARQRMLDEDRAMQELMDASDEAVNYESGDELKFIRAGFPPRLIKRLRRGDFTIQDKLDLHGLIVDQAKQYTHGFINECFNDGVRAVRIVHGKGRNSADRVPVIKSMLLGWLKKNPHVVAAVSAPVNDGGTGAVYVLLAAK